MEFGKGKPELHSNFKPLGTRVKTKIKQPGYNRMWRLPQAFGVINLQIEIKSLLVFFFFSTLYSPWYRLSKIVASSQNPRYGILCSKPFKHARICTLSGSYIATSKSATFSSMPTWN